jgi:MraZ protein
MPIDEFQRIYEQARQVPVTSKQARDFLRGFLSGANDEVPDKQGRITIPSVLRAYAGLKREITAIGVGTRVELWDAAAWETYMEQQESAYSDLSEQIFPDMAF